MLLNFFLNKFKKLSILLNPFDFLNLEIDHILLNCIKIPLCLKLV